MNKIDVANEIKTYDVYLSVDDLVAIFTLNELENLLKHYKYTGIKIKEDEYWVIK